MNTLYVQKDSFVHRLDPRTKILFVVGVVVSTFLFGDPKVQLFLLGGLLPLVAAAKIVRPYLVSMQFLMLFVVLIMTVHGIYNPMGKTVIFELFGLTFKYESLVYASVMSFRILVIGTAAVLFVMTTHPADLASALLKWKVPHSLAFILLSTFQIIPIIAREAKVVMEAQQARCLDVQAGLLQRVKHLVPLFAPLFIVTFMKVHQLSYVLECRAFSSNRPKTSLRETRISFRDYLFLAGMGGVLAFEVALRFVFADWLTPVSTELLIGSLVTVWVIVGVLLIHHLLKRLRLRSGGVHG